MASRDDRRAALILLVLALVGLGVRWLGSGSGPPGAVAYRAAPAPRPRRDSVAARAARLARPLGARERIDVDRAPAEELLRLPRIGPALAARIVADREREGPFGSLEALARVPGIGAGTLAALREHVAFSAPAAAHLSIRVEHGGLAGLLVILNTAATARLAELPGIGPSRARAIVDDRARHGPYATLDDLQRVRGIGPALVERLKARAETP